MDIQRINLKVMFASSPPLDVLAVLEVFSRWRHETNFYEWIDLADYGHMHEGPRALLVGRQGNLGLDYKHGQMGLFFHNKRGLSGSLTARLTQALGYALRPFARLLGEPTFLSTLHLDLARWQISASDRVTMPPNVENQAAFLAASQAVLSDLCGANAPDTFRTIDTHGCCEVHIDGTHALPMPRWLEILKVDTNATTQVSNPGVFDEISAEASLQLLHSGEGFLYLDVRTEGEFALGHPQGAYNLPVRLRGEQGEQMVPNPAFLSTALRLFAKDAPLLIGCRTNQRSRIAAQLLSAEGFTRIKINRAGFEGTKASDGSPAELGWLALGLPLELGESEGRSYQALLASASSLKPTP